MLSILQSNWMVTLLGAAGYCATTIAVWNPPPVARAPVADPGEGPPLASWNFRNPEVDQLIVDLRDEKQAIESKQKELAELEARLKAEWQEICATTQTVYRMQQEFDRHVVRLKDEETANLKRLAKVYAAMEPDAAVNILKELEDDQIVKILVFLKDEQTAPILEGIARLADGSKRAANVSARLQVALYRNNSTSK